MDLPPDPQGFAALFVGDIPLIDVRAPVEFARGAFPCAANLPLMVDAERQQVGLRYKQQGQDAAIALGMRLVSGAVKAQRVQAWRDFAQAHPQGYLYCFRGGLRSKISQQWLREEGKIEYPRIPGGYKALRGYLMEVTERVAADGPLVVLGGMTGTGKTDVLRQLGEAVDLEAHANHRGSGFGKRATPQPAQIDFEHRIAIDLLKKHAAGMRGIVLEDESRNIGSVFLPPALHGAMQECPLVWLDAEFDERVERIRRDYVVDLCAEFMALHGEAGFERFGERLQASLNAIARRLGGERHARALQLMQTALARQRLDGEGSGHRHWIGLLLKEYYDPMYHHQLQGKAARIAMRGSMAEVVDYLRAGAWRQRA
jgi:tRNA 2-selenouridine synthase